MNNDELINMPFRNVHSSAIHSKMWRMPAKWRISKRKVYTGNDLLFYYYIIGSHAYITDIKVKESEK